MKTDSITKPTTQYSSARLVLLFAILGISITLLSTSCKKENFDKTDYTKLVGTTWLHETDDVFQLLQFIDQSTVTIQSGRKDGTYSMNLTTYSWLYASDIDDKWGLFHMYSKTFDNEQGKLIYSGTVEKGLVLLKKSNDNTQEDLRFTQIKKK